jgi:ribonuclease HI
MVIYADGGCKHMMRENGRLMVTAYGSFMAGDKIHRYMFGKGTSQTAEYRTLIAALEYCRKNYITRPVVFMDSKSVVDAMNDKATPSAGCIITLYTKAHRLAKIVGAEVKWTSREELVKRLGH